jgi:CheY-like chemotaxis protein
MAERRILVVDDEKEIRDLFSAYLASRGYKIFLAGDGEEGVIQLSQNQPINLVVTDCRMHSMDGFEFSKHAKQTYGIPTIMVTAYNDGKEDKNLSEYGIVKIVNKPVDLRELKSSIDMFCQTM